MNIIQNANRQTIRTNIDQLNDIFGRKVFVQPRVKNASGLWSPSFKGGIKKLPLNCPPRSKPVQYYLGGVLVTVKKSRVSRNTARPV